jgi:hypothetical protein
MAPRQEYDFTKPSDVDRFLHEQSKPNEEAWLILVAYMEANHNKISIDDVKLYERLVRTQGTLDRIRNRLRPK